MSKTQTYLITGCSAGFGWHLAHTALSHGHNVIATSRNPSKTPGLVKEIEANPRGKWLSLDVSASATEIQTTIDKARTFFGGIDVLINNAGYSVLGAAEDIPEQQAKDQFEVNFWGLIRLTKAVLPTMRSQGSGTVVNISSIGGIRGVPTGSIYNGSKFALEGWSECMSQEVAPLGIRVLVVEPGAFRTNFLGQGALQTVPASQAYKGGPVEAVFQRFDAMNGKQVNDPVKGAEKIIANIERGLKKEELGKTKHLRLPLGQDCYDQTMTKMGDLHANFEAAKEEAFDVLVEE